MPTRHRARHRLVAIAAAAICGAFAFVSGAQAAPTTGPTLTEALEALPVEDEVRDGYDRDLFKHWVDADKNRCHTRNEVLIAEAVMAPAVDDRCRLSGGLWYSYYDDQYIDNARSLDIDHLVPLAEAWDSGAREWDADRREAYANDLGNEISLIAVTASSNRSKADKDPAEWMPPSASAACQYAYEWISVKTRWELSIDQTEADALAAIIADCPSAVVTATAP